MPFDNKEATPTHCDYQCTMLVSHGEQFGIGILFATFQFLDLDGFEEFLVLCPDHDRLVLLIQRDIVVIDGIWKIPDAPL